jgi:osmotically-inducible protein OsmY
VPCTFPTTVRRPLIAAVLSQLLTGCAIFHKCGSDACSDDQKITAEIESLFAQHPVLMPPNLIYVHTIDHVVYLTGQVNTDLERQIAQAIALQAPGATRVENSIALGYP